MTDKEKIKALSELVHQAYHAGWRARQSWAGRGPGDGTDTLVTAWNRSDARESLQDIKRGQPCR